VRIWSEHVVPRLTHRFLSGGPIDRIRAEALDGLTGEVVEIGFGSGANLPFYPATVRSLVAVEPSPVARRLAGARIAAWHAEAGARDAQLRLVPVRAEELALESASADAVVSTFTLCSVSDPARALAEIRRVLRPGGRFVFVEHGLSPEGRVARWQHRLTPLHRRVAGGCHLDRPVESLVAGARLDLVELRSGHLEAAPRVTEPWVYLYRGVATPR
jgi:ubiquinone/menaquinone biosynthesis C-methylase UbiE